MGARAPMINVTPSDRPGQATERPSRNKLFYCELPKTGSGALRLTLPLALGKGNVSYYQHAVSKSHCADHSNVSRQFILASVREPCSWMVSSYGYNVPRMVFHDSRHSSNDFNALRASFQDSNGSQLSKTVAISDARYAAQMDAIVQNASLFRAYFNLSKPPALMQMLAAHHPVAEPWADCWTDTENMGPLWKSACVGSMEGECLDYFDDILKPKTSLDTVLAHAAAMEKAAPDRR